MRRKKIVYTCKINVGEIALRFTDFIKTHTHSSFGASRSVHIKCHYVFDVYFNVTKTQRRRETRVRDLFFGTPEPRSREQMRELPEGDFSKYP